MFGNLPTLESKLILLHNSIFMIIIIALGRIV